MVLLKSLIWKMRSGAKIDRLADEEWMYIFFLLLLF